MSRFGIKRTIQGNRFYHEYKNDTYFAKVGVGSTGLFLEDNFGKFNLSKEVITSNINFNPTNIVLDTKETFFNTYTQVGDLTISTPTNNYGVGASFIVKISTSGDTITLPDGWYTVVNNYDSDEATYVLSAYYDGEAWIASINLLTLVE